MAAVDTPQPSGGKKKGKHKKKRRVGVKLDMTPMVDVAFLLLTFFMLTTSFSTPQTMEINLPPLDAPDVKIAESNIMIVRVFNPTDSVQAAKGKMMPDRIFWNIGSDKPIEVKLDNNGFRKAVETSMINPKLVVVVKLDKKAHYKTMVDILDELNVTKMNRFSLTSLTQYDREEVMKVL
jgi:biopolymer transport protein ExbD